VKSATQAVSAGCGVRVIAGERTGYAYTTIFRPSASLHAAPHGRAHRQWPIEAAGR